MKEEKFKVIEFIRNLIISLDDELTNFPKKDIELKNRIRSNSYDILELCYEANTTTNVIARKAMLEKAIAKIKTLDFLIDLCYEKTIINSKKYLKFGRALDDIIKYTTGWIKKYE